MEILPSWALQSLVPSVGTGIIAAACKVAGDWLVGGEAKAGNICAALVSWSVDATSNIVNKEASEVTRLLLVDSSGAVVVRSASDISRESGSTGSEVVAAGICASGWAYRCAAIVSVKFSEVALSNLVSVRSACKVTTALRVLGKSEGSNARRDTSVVCTSSRYLRLAAVGTKVL